MGKSKANMIKAGMWYIVCNIILKSIGLLTTPLFVRVLSQNDVGMFSNIQSWVSILTILSSLSLYSSVNNAKFDYEGRSFNSFLSSITVLGTIITVIFLCVLLCFYSILESILGIEKKYFVIIFAYLFFQPATSIYLAKNRSSLLYKQTIVVTISTSVLTIGISLLLVLMLPNKLDGRVAGAYIPSAFIGLALYIVLVNKGKTVAFSHWKYTLSISFPLAVHLLSGTILSSTDRIMITNVCGASDTALYSVAYLLVSIPTLLWESVNAAWGPWCFIQFNEKSFFQVRKNSKFLLFCFGILIFLVALLAPEGLYVLGGNDYVVAAPAVPPTLCGCILVIAYTLYVNVEQFYKKQVFVAIGTSIAAIINITLNYLFIPIFGYIAAAYTTMVGFFMLFVFHYLICKYMLKKNSIYDTRFMFCFLAAVIMAIFSNLVLYSYTIIRYMIVGLTTLTLIGLIYIKRKQLFNIIRAKSIA